MIRLESLQGRFIEDEPHSYLTAPHSHPAR